MSFTQVILGITGLVCTTLLSLLLAGVNGIGRKLDKYIEKTDVTVAELEKTTQKHGITLYGENGDNGLLGKSKKTENRLTALERFEGAA